MAKRPGSAGDPRWYKDAIIYQLHVRAFKDSTSDGVGDFAGWIRKLGYLQDLGGTCRWSLPFFPAPPKDDGDDISGYRNVHVMNGTRDDFRFFLAGAHECTVQFPLARSSREADACWRYCGS
jgi:maltose alpha-D-glucosyltransferase / alpha-amylase